MRYRFSLLNLFNDNLLFFNSEIKILLIIAYQRSLNANNTLIKALSSKSSPTQILHRQYD
ncbi:hypothetical protein PROSTU_03960 [Providencia stuartii ATCC 25827]|uniref:Uncharacterized protein n=1 Tax=Providencia stuartii ATCC 25827 TaxID=471874 RepID=A0AA86YGI3_PROST|nr:hypothetical protein PROSTU_03960 [Providencia stuartii ATCC 25827]